MKICHLTSAHPQEDVRIFYKECTSLALHGYETYQISCGKKYDKAGVHLVGIGLPAKERATRMLKTTRAIYMEAIRQDADVYHLHDPELLPYGIWLTRRKKIVFFDSHEDIPSQIMDKTWIPKPLRYIVSMLYKALETYAVKRFDAVVAATPHIAEKFRGRAKKIVVVNNYPKQNDIAFHTTPFSNREAVVCYAGGINDNRGEGIMKKAMQDVKGTLIIAGDHPIQEQGNAKYVGRLNRADINKLYGKAVVGLCILKPIDNYLHSQPIKLYEYMAAGIPFVCSDFPGWRRVAEESQGGLCVDPNDIMAIRTAISELLADRARAQEMGKKGHSFMANHYTWENEEKTLLMLYTTTLENRKVS